MPYGTVVVEWAGGEGLHFFPFLLLLLLLYALHSKGSTTSRLCSHYDFAFFTLQSQYVSPTTWNGFGNVFSHCLQLHLQQRLSDTFLPHLWSLTHPYRVLWNTVKQNSTLNPLYPDIVTVQKSLKSTEAENKYTVFWKVISHCMWNTSEALKGEIAKWISLEKVHPFNQVNLKINLVHLVQICNVGFCQSFYRLCISILLLSVSYWWCAGIINSLIPMA